jgi:hypothetical protein
MKDDQLIIMEEMNKAFVMENMTNAQRKFACEIIGICSGYIINHMMANMDEYDNMDGYTGAMTAASNLSDAKKLFPYEDEENKYDA